MTYRLFIRATVITIGALAGCGGSQPPIGAQHAAIALTVPAVKRYTSLYSFQVKPDGDHPEGRLIPLGKTLYGTTTAGGTKCMSSGCGTIFKITTTGSETVLHRFQGLPDGADPVTELVAVKGELYGTTYSGGVRCKPPGTTTDGCGTVFAIDTSGVERVLYRFTGIPDGAYPQGPLTFVNGKFYGTTISGGTACANNPDGCGTVYSIEPSGKEHVLHRFTGEPDGSLPAGNLVFLNGTFYGTTLGGGTNRYGTVFAIQPSGQEVVIYNASGGNDIASPSGLVALAGVLYGTGAGGGSQDYGAVYSVTTGGYERVLHRFIKFRNGANPSERLIAVNGLLYGATGYGGLGLGSGVLYAISTSGRFHILYRFKGPPDGDGPYAGLTDANGTLYGTTISGGSGCHYQSCQDGYGTVFRLTR